MIHFVYNTYMNFVIFARFHHISIQKTINFKCKTHKSLKQTEVQIYFYFALFLICLFNQPKYCIITNNRSKLIQFIVANSNVYYNLPRLFKLQMSPEPCSVDDTFKGTLMIVLSEFLPIKVSVYVENYCMYASVIIKLFKRRIFRLKFLYIFVLSRHKQQINRFLHVICLIYIFKKSIIMRKFMNCIDLIKCQFVKIG